MISYITDFSTLKSNIFRNTENPTNQATAYKNIPNYINGVKARNDIPVTLKILDDGYRVQTFSNDRTSFNSTYNRNHRLLYAIAAFFKNSSENCTKVDNIQHECTMGDNETVSVSTADPKRCTKNVQSPNETDLMLAVRGGNLKNAQALINKGDDVDVYNADGETALMIAADYGNIAMLDVLLDAGADINKRQIASIVDPNEDFRVRIMEAMQSDDCATALMFAMSRGNIEVMQELIKRGANVNIKNAAGESPLGMAVKHCPMAVQLLLENGADVDAQNNHGETALMHATLCDEPNISYALLNWRADVNIKNKLGLSALACALQISPPGTVQILIAAKSDVHTRDAKGNTTLMIGVNNYSYLENLEALIYAGVDINAENYEGKTALMFAAEGERDMHDIYNLLICNGATPIQPKDA